MKSINMFSEDVAVEAVLAASKEEVQTPAGDFPATKQEKASWTKK